MQKYCPTLFLIIQLKGRVDTGVSYHNTRLIKTNFLKNKNLKNKHLTTYD